jgi:hypothetical protein
LAWWLGFPQAHGVVEVAGGGFVLFSVTGMSSLTNSNGVHLMMIQTENAADGWLTRRRWPSRSSG